MTIEEVDTSVAEAIKNELKTSFSLLLVELDEKAVAGLNSALVFDLFEHLVESNGSSLTQSARYVEISKYVREGHLELLEREGSLA